MSEFIWTEEQKRVIDSRDKNILVSAGAGSGKTAVLTERLKHLVLEEREDCSKMLVLTFTRAAAAEMKQRFIDKLYEALEEEGWNLTEREILSQIDALTDAQISTIDSFATMMARRYFEVAGVDPGFRIADQSELRLIEEETFDEVFEELFSKAEEEEKVSGFTKLIDIYGGSRSNDELKKILKDLIDFMESLPYPYQWLENTYKSIDETSEGDFFNLPIFDGYYNLLLNFAKRVKNTYREIELLNREVTWKKGNASQKVLEAEIENAHRLGESETLIELIENLKNFEIGTVRYPKNDKIITDQIKSLRGLKSSGLLKEINEYHEFFSGFDLELEYKRSIEMNEHFKSLFELVSLIERRMSEKKERARILSFSDVERALLKILSDPKTRQEIQSEYQYIFLDEFQDTNDLQEEYDLFMS